MSQDVSTTSLRSSAPTIPLRQYVPEELVTTIFSYLCVEAVSELLPEWVRAEVGMPHHPRYDRSDAPIVPHRWWHTYLARILDISATVGHGDYLPYEPEDAEYYPLVVASIIERYPSLLLLLSCSRKPRDIWTPNYASLRDMWASSQGGPLILSLVSRLLAGQGGKLLQTIYVMASVVNNSDLVYGAFKNVVSAGQSVYTPNVEEVPGVVMGPSYAAVATILLGWLDENGWLWHIPYSYRSWNVILNEGASIASDSRISPPPLGVRLLHVIFLGSHSWWRSVDNRDGNVPYYIFNEYMGILCGVISILLDETIDEMYHFLTSSYPEYRGMYDVFDYGLYSHDDMMDMLATMNRAFQMIGRTVGYLGSGDILEDR